MVSLICEWFDYQGKSQGSSFQILENWGYFLVAKILHESKEMAFWVFGLKRVAWPERLVFLVDVFQNFQVEAESEQNLPGEDALLALIDLHSHLLSESLAVVLQNGFMVTMLSREWVRCQTLPAGDMTVACLVTSSSVYIGWPSWTTSWPPLSFVLNLPFQHPLGLYELFHFLATAWLTVFDCVKISFSHPSSSGSSRGFLNQCSGCGWAP